MQESALLIGSPNGSLSLTESCLAELQLDVTVAETGEEALQALVPERHALVVGDLPIADLPPGLLVSRLRRASRATSVLLIAGPPKGPEVEEAIKLGADECVARPIHRPQLIEAIARALATWRLALDAESSRAAAEGPDGEPSAGARGAVETLTRCLEAKDFLSNGHARSVARMAAQIATHLGLADEEVQEARLASAVHDLGKLAVRQEILCKPGALSEEEWQEIRRHPHTGAEILRGIRPLNGVARYVRHHHESYDGSGYPDGLHGGEIPLTSRIIAVADAYDAMMTARPYRQHLGYAYAAREFRQRAGVQWDTDVVDGLFACVPQLSLAT
jgi:putative two-component system response regulator